MFTYNSGGQNSHNSLILFMENRGFEPEGLTSSESNTYATEPEQNRADTKQINALPDSAPSTEKQNQTPPEHGKNTFLHPKCVTCVHQGETLLPDDLRELIDAWGHLPDAIKIGIMAMVRTSQPDSTQVASSR